MIALALELNRRLRDFNVIAESRMKNSAVLERNTEGQPEGAIPSILVQVSHGDLVWVLFLQFVPASAGRGVEPCVASVTLPAFLDFIWAKVAFLHSRAVAK